MTNPAFDNPLVRSVVFHPRVARAEYLSSTVQVADGTIPVEKDVVLGYRFYFQQPSVPVILFFHGNGEVATDYDGVSAEFNRIGASLLVVDFRGYGWSSGQPSVSALLADPVVVLAALPDLFSRYGITSEKVIVMGRSLGSACAVQLAYTHPDKLQGLIVESGFTEMLSLTWIPSAVSRLVEPINNLQKIREVTIPLLIIHGERDTLIPVSHGQALFDGSPAARKQILLLPGAGHNDLMLYGIDRYFEAIRNFIG